MRSESKRTARCSHNHGKVEGCRMTTPRTVKISAKLQKEIDDMLPLLTEAIRALIRGFLPTRLRNKPFAITIDVTHNDAVTVIPLKQLVTNGKKANHAVPNPKAARPGQD